MMTRRQLIRDVVLYIVMLLTHDLAGFQAAVLLLLFLIVYVLLAIASAIREAAKKSG
jgi:hypothetical protein